MNSKLILCLLLFIVIVLIFCILFLNKENFYTETEKYKLPREYGELVGELKNLNLTLPSIPL